VVAAWRKTAHPRQAMVAQTRPTGPCNGEGCPGGVVHGGEGGRRWRAPTVSRERLDTLLEDKTLTLIGDRGYIKILVHGPRPVTDMEHINT
jgi:hypothetical protein